ncbi:sugar ABC transporter ATP-binding protein [Youxingia wuxianensis]
MDEIMEISDRAMVLRDGKASGDFATANTTIDEIIQCMIGRSISNYYIKNKAQPGEELLRVEGLCREGQYEDISFSVRRGEIVGLYGLVGAGRTEIVESLFGITRPSRGDIYYKGKKIQIRNSVQAVRHKMAFVPENRKEQGLVLGETCRKNISLVKLPWIKKGGFVDTAKTFEIYEEYRHKLKINAASSEQLTAQLSGGNQQKIVLGKWLAIQPDLLILDEPTRGIDIGAKADIHRFISQLAEEGMAVILISSEMPEIIGVSNRLLCIRDGRICAQLSGEDINEQRIINAIMNQPEDRSNPAAS